MDKEKSVMKKYVCDGVIYAVTARFADSRAGDLRDGVTRLIKNDIQAEKRRVTNVDIGGKIRE